MRGKSFPFNLSEDAYEPWKIKDDLADFYTRSISDILQSTFHDPRTSVENMPQDIAEIKQLTTCRSF